MQKVSLGTEACLLDSSRKCFSISLYGFIEKGLVIALKSAFFFELDFGLSAMNQLEDWSFNTAPSTLTETVMEEGESLPPPNICASQPCLQNELQTLELLHSYCIHVNPQMYSIFQSSKVICLTVCIIHCLLEFKCHFLKNGNLL